MNNDDSDKWKAAKAHFDETRQAYRDSEGIPGVNTSLALTVVFAPLALRYDKGERSPELLEAMLNVE